MALSNILFKSENENHVKLDNNNYGSVCTTEDFNTYVTHADYMRIS